MKRFFLMGLLILLWGTLIPVNPNKFPKANYSDSMKFVKWLTDPEKGQKIIRDFGQDKYGGESGKSKRADI